MRILTVALTALTLAFLTIAAPARASDCTGAVDTDCDNHDTIVQGDHCAVWVHLVTCLDPSVGGGDCTGTVDVDCDNHDIGVQGSHCLVWVHRVTCIG